MALDYRNLDGSTRQFMFKELDRDLSQGTLYISSRLNERGIQGYVSLLRDALQNNNDAWLADQLRRHNYLNTHEQRRKPKGGVTIVQVPVTAADTLAEGEFNRFYMRGVCARAIEEGVTEVEVYRGRSAMHPRPESEAIIGKKIFAKILLEDLRQSFGKEPDLGLPQPNSGLTIQLS